MGYFIFLLRISNLWDFVIVILVGILMIEKNIARFVFFMGDNVVSWYSKKQSIVALSTCEFEYMVATSCICHAIWLRRLLEETCLPQDGIIGIYFDNKSTPVLAKNLAFHDWSKHIDTRYHFIREHVVKKETELNYVKT